MHVGIRDNVHIYFTHISDQEERIIWEEFSVSRPNMYVDISSFSGWDGVYRKYNRSKKRMARPFLAHLRVVCQKHNLPLIVEDYRDPWGYNVLDPELVKNDFLPGITLDDYQIKAIQACLRSECGVVDVPPGGGKTELMAGICKAIPCPTVLLADQRVIVDQIKQRLELRDVAETVGLFYAGKRPNGELVIVGSIQSVLAPTKAPEPPSSKVKNFDSAMKAWERKMTAFNTRRANAKTLMEFIHKAEMLIVDECDKCTSPGWADLFKKHYFGRRRYGMSGTPTDPSRPVEAMVLQEHLGSIIFREDRKTLTDLGRIVECEYNTLAFGLDGRADDASTYDIAVDEWMVHNPRFHKLIATLAGKYAVGDKGMVILVDREALGTNLLNLLQANGISSEFIFGKTPKPARNRALRDFEARRINVLIGGKIIHRGLDLRGGCEYLFFATGGKMRSEVIQKISRALRRNKYNHSVIFDVYFRCNKHLYSHSRDRLKIVDNLGYPTFVIFPGGRVNGREFIQSRFHIKQQYLGIATKSK